ncbi:galactosyldiacylglycerol synthase [Aneurinibacillus migulanus]|uniref:MGDG synthase family glycosyltransferase n=1 Tax=Aneurinibacillus migulanus TaxID=47500 RepID=UPI0005BD6221|nr:glycosyltransferase [Aneurinibacillus migulanus]KIV49935.1 galactosyldiacylglycerol synthase [Aneurinibacillus migulanus]KPD04581.1 galactosyldiacylglycerol synthase [Aneurinibacillus migulanus]MCP1357132.1 galactosyldiacylglycerol synthase [Aneurinibacillus migulanus]CEH32336.1 Monogalactosyldiacylglycerol synthase [Aneurinibacillus migulanus]
MSKKILVLSEAIGAGHTKAAEGLMQGILYLAPSMHIKIVEVGKKLHPLTTMLLFQIYLKMIFVFPFLWRKMYRYKQNVPLSMRRKFIIYHLFHRRIKMLVELECPDLVVCTHPFICSSISRLKRMGYTWILCTVITDFHVHGNWVHPEVDVYLVSSKKVQEQLLQMGIPECRIIITGLPIRESFWIKHEKQDIRQKLQLKNIPTVLIIGGGLGLGGIREVAHSLLKWKEEVQVIICIGSNKILKKRLIRDKRFNHPNIRILDFVENIDEWMDASDLLITKPGGLTCFEALFKGIPLLLYRPIPGHEESNSDCLIEHCLAIKANNQREVNDWMKKLLFSPEGMKTLRQQVEQFRQTINPLASAEFIVKQLML